MSDAQDFALPGVWDRSLLPSELRNSLIKLAGQHAAQYADALADRLAGANLAQLTVSSCPVLIGASGPEPRCTRVTDFAYNEFFQRANIDAVVIGSRWGPDRLSMLDRSLQLLRSKGIEVIVIGPVFEFEGSFPLILARSLESGDPAQVETLRREGGDALERQLRSLVERGGATYYSARARECDAESCRYMTEDGVPLHFDYGHLTNAGARYLLRDFPNPTALYRDSQAQH